MIFRILDYFCENYLSNVIDYLMETTEVFRDFLLSLLDLIMAISLFITLPIWILPYWIWKRTGGGKKMSVHSKPTQNERILAYIEEFGSITQLEALRDLGVMRLASRISDLRKQGYNITSEIITVKNRYDENCHIKRYRLNA